METVNSIKRGDVIDFGFSFCGIRNYPAIRMRQPTDCLAEYTSQRPNVNVLPHFYLRLTADFVWSEAFRGTLIIISEKIRLRIRRSIPYVLVPYVSLAVEFSREDETFLKWLIPKSASLNFHSWGYCAPPLTTRMFSGLIS